MRIVVFALVVGLLCSDAAFARERLNLHLAFGQRTPLYGALAERFVAEVGERSAGRLRLRPHEPGAIVPRFGYLDAVAQGAIDAAWGTPAVLAGRAPEAVLFTGVPFGLGPVEHLAWIRDGAGRPLYNALYARFGVIGVPCAAVGPDGLAWLRQPLDDTAPFRGLRMRAFGLAARILDGLGATTAFAFGADLTIGLATGAFDGAEVGVPVADFAYGLHEVAPIYLYPSPLQPATLLDVVINRDRWQRLEPEARVTLEEACRATAAFAEGANRETNAAALDRIAAAGVSVSAPSPATVAALRRAWDELRSVPEFVPVLRVYPAASD
ncbi:ABC transporter substrate-binding protein [Thalassobaculum fulvum]|uniref:ABC transporter substrate-binding protein n=1 Tax=Thalassobaculum fulvum TaxID=1633335 RepID=A0A919CRV5_9PROT|nr:ABC transporter substrate-binding protein [Thalassobaculum fulvum]